MCKKCHFDTRNFKNISSHTLPRSVASLPRFGPRWKFLATPVVMIKCEDVRLKMLYKLYNYVNCIIMILTTVIRNIYIIFYSLSKTIFSELWRLFISTKYTKGMQKSYDRKHQNQKAPHRGRGKPPAHTHPPPPPLASLVRAWSLRSLACPPPPPWRGMPGTPLIPTRTTPRLQLVIPKVRYSEGSVNPKVRYSEGPLFRSFVNPKMK